MGRGIGIRVVTAWCLTRPAYSPSLHLRHLLTLYSLLSDSLHPLAVYAAVQAHKGEKMEFPGDIEAWMSVREHSSAMLTGYLSEWAVLEEKVSFSQSMRFWLDWLTIRAVCESKVQRQRYLPHPT